MWKTHPIWLALLCLSLPERALAEGEESPFSMSGTLFGYWGYDLGNQGNEFGIERVYLTARRSLGSDFAVRVTTDVDRPEGDKLRPYLKYAYLEWAGGPEGVKIRLGAAATPFVGFSSGFWGHRYVAKAFTDEERILSSSDLGVHALGSHAGGQLTWQAGLLNGEGYGTPEGGASKSAQLRASWDPLAAGEVGSLPVSAFVSYSPRDLLSGDRAELTWAAALGYRCERGVMWAELVGDREGTGEDALVGSGYSASLLPRLGGLGSLLLRYDHWDPDSSTGGDAATTLLAGMTRDLSGHVSAGLLYERTQGEGSTPLEHDVFLRMRAEF